MHSGEMQRFEKVQFLPVCQSPFFPQGTSLVTIFFITFLSKDSSTLLFLKTDYVKQIR